jgi:hypothetical protein
MTGRAEPTGAAFQSQQYHWECHQKWRRANTKSMQPNPLQVRPPVAVNFQKACFLPQRARITQSFFVFPDVAP